MDMATDVAGEQFPSDGTTSVEVPVVEDDRSL